MEKTRAQTGSAIGDAGATGGLIGCTTTLVSAIPSYTRLLSSCGFGVSRDPETNALWFLRDDGILFS